MRKIGEELQQNFRDTSPSWVSLVREYRDHQSSRGLSCATRRLTQGVLRILVAFLDGKGLRVPQQVDAAVLSAFWLQVARRRARVGWRRGRLLCPNTLHSYRTVVRGFFRWLVQQEILLLDPTAFFTWSQPGRSLPRVLTPTEVLRLLTVPVGEGPMALRDQAMLETLYGSGLRAGELLGLDLGDVDLVGGVLTLRRTKGGRDRTVPVGTPALEALDLYLKKGREAFVWASVGELSPAVFLTCSGTRVRYGTLRTRLAERARAAGLEGRLTLHMLRHAAAVHMLKGGADPRSLQEFLGHASLVSTCWYTRLMIEDLKVELRKCHPRGRLEL